MEKLYSVRKKLEETRCNNGNTLEKLDTLETSD